MSRAARSGAPAREFIGIQWGAAGVRACLIGPAGVLLDETVLEASTLGPGRAGVAALMDELGRRWPQQLSGRAGPSATVYAAGLLACDASWGATLAHAPASLADLGARMRSVRIAGVAMRLLPALACTRGFDGGPDLMCGEEIELFGVAALYPDWDGFVALPGAHTRWARFTAGQARDFFTNMSGELYDCLGAAGLPAGPADGAAAADDAFFDGVRLGSLHHLGLSTLLPGAPARAHRPMPVPAQPASFLRGLLIGSEIADALALDPHLAAVPLIGAGPLCRLYAAALERLGIRSWLVEPRLASLAGFTALHLAQDR